MFNELLSTKERKNVGGIFVCYYDNLTCLALEIKLGLMWSRSTEISLTAPL